MKKILAVLFLIPAVPGACCAMSSSASSGEDTGLIVIATGIVCFIVYAFAFGGKKKTKGDVFFAQLLAAGAYTRTVSAECTDLYIPYGDDRYVINYSRTLRSQGLGETGRGALLALGAEVQVTTGMRLRKEGAADRLAEGLGLQGRAGTGDPDFDAGFRLESDDGPFAARYFSSYEKRAAVKALFGAGCREIEFRPDGVWTSWYMDAEMTSDAGFISNALPYLAALARGFNPAQSGATADGTPPAPVKLRRSEVENTLSALRGGIGLALLFSLVFMLQPSVGLQPAQRLQAFLASLHWSGLPMAVLLLAALAAFKGKLWFRSVFPEIAVYIILGIPVAGYWGFCLANADQDKGAAVEYSVPVLASHSGHNRRGNYYDITIKRWGGEGNMDLSVSQDLYEAIKGIEKYQKVTLFVKPGRLGYEWVQTWKIKPVAAPGQDHENFMKFWGLGGGEKKPEAEPEHNPFQ